MTQQIEERAVQHDQQASDEHALFLNMPPQVSSASSLNSNASYYLEPTQNFATLNNNITATTTSGYSKSINISATSPNYGATTAAAAASLASTASMISGAVPEFLYQLTKMLTDPNKEIIEWSTYSGNGRIEVHNPARLESEVLCRYFRHSKYSSFQRQLNYFGFRKIAGKGKMSPCSYVNDAATLDIQSLLLMKRKCSEKERNLGGADASSEGILSASLPVSNNIKSNKRHLNPGNDIQPVTVQPMFAHRNISFDTMAATVAKNIDIYKQQQSSSSISTANSEFHEFKRTKLEQSSLTQEDTDRNGYTIAIGKGVRHQLNGYLRSSSNGSSVINYNNNNATSSSSIHNHNLTWLVHPPSIKATASPAPLQFLDPNELGMSVTSASYLNQLKSNFDASVADYTAATTSAVDAAAIPSSSAEDDTAAAGTDGRYISQAVSISGTSSATTNSATSLSRVSSQASFFGMLRKDDSLINLAMLPTLDTTSNNTNNTDLSSSNNGFGQVWKNSVSSGSTKPG